MDNICFIRLIDGTMGVGNLVLVDDEQVVINNMVELGSFPIPDLIEQKYFFKGFFCPFSNSTPIVSTFDRINVLNITENLDIELISQYNNYINHWFDNRPRYYKRPKQKKTQERLTSELVEEYLEAFANTTIH